MELSNLSSQTPIQNSINSESSTKKYSLSLIFIIFIMAITAGFFLSRYLPGKGPVKLSNMIPQKDVITSTDKIDKTQIEVGKIYGNTSSTFSDGATGVVQSGNINGVGTHILVRDGGLSQRVSLLSSTIDLDLFVNRKVEVKGQTNASSKTGWLLDVGSVKVIE